MTRVAFPDWTVNIIEIFSDSDIVVVRWEGMATHNGVFQSIPPTGKRISVSGINIYRFEYGKISAEWEQMDSLGMLKQLGVLG
jgi:predicted ester cyclase